MNPTVMTLQFVAIRPTGRSVLKVALSSAKPCQTVKCRFYRGDFVPRSSPAPRKEAP